MSDIEKSNEDIQEQIRKEIKVDAEGKGYASIKGTARLAGIDDTELGRNLKSAAGEKPTKLAQFLIAQKVQPAVLAKVGEDGVPDYVVTLVVKYYAFLAGRYCNATAKTNDLATGGMGMRVYFRQLAGWKPSATTESVEEFITRQLPMVANVWELRFPPIFWEKLNRVYGLKRGDQGCAMFLKTYIYGVFPKEVLERLEEVNPANENGNRPHKIHQHLNGIFLTALVKQIEAVMTLLDVASDKSDFKQLAKRLKTLRLVRMPSTNSLPPTTEQ